MHVITSNVQRVQCPTAKLAFFHDGVANDFPAPRIEQVWLLRHLLTIRRTPLWVWLDQFRFDHVVLIIDGGKRLAVKPSSIGREGQEICQRLISHGFPSREL